MGLGNMPRGVRCRPLGQGPAPAAVDSLDANMAPCGTWAHPRWPVDWVMARGCRGASARQFRDFSLPPAFFFGGKIRIMDNFFFF